MTVGEKTWRKTWGNFNWKRISPTEIDDMISKGRDTSMVVREEYPFGYDHTNPLIESLKADNPVVFSHLIRSGADVNFRLPYVNLYPDGPRYGVRSVVRITKSDLYQVCQRKRNGDIPRRHFGCNKSQRKWNRKEDRIFSQFL